MTPEGRVPAFVYQVPDYLLPPNVSALEVLVRLVPDDVPEVCMRPSNAGIGLRVWGPPLDLIRAER